MEGKDFSFGLHSPDNVPFDVTSSSAMTSSGKELFINDNIAIGNFNKSNLVLEDGDLIDLTTLPPPLTPDEDKFLLSCITPGLSFNSLFI